MTKYEFLKDIQAIAKQAELEGKYYNTLEQNVKMKNENTRLLNLVKKKNLKIK